MKDQLGLTLTHPSGIYRSRTSLNSHIMSRPRNCQEVQNIFDNKVATEAVHLDPDHHPRDKFISARHNYSICRLAKVQTTMDRQAHFFLFF